MKEKWLHRFIRAARWMLPPEEAAEAEADYRDILAQTPRTGEELRRDLGGPAEAARLLIQPRYYYSWLAVFCVLAVCLLLPAASLLYAPLAPFGVYEPIPLFNSFWEFLCQNDS